MKAAEFIKKEQEFLHEQITHFGKTQSKLILLSFLLFIVVSASYLAVSIEVFTIPLGYLTIIQKVLYSVLIFLTANLFLKFTTPLLNRSTRFLDLTTRRLTLKLWNYIVWIIAFVLIISQFTGNIESLGLSIGLISAGLAIALQQPITSIVAFMIINAKRIYRIGDRIIVKDLKGDVIDISAFHTVLREFGRGMEGDDPTGVLVMIPNNIILTEAVFNYTQEFPYIWDEVGVSITYESDFEFAQDLIKDAAKEVLGEDIEKAVSRMRFYLKDTPQEDMLQEEPVVFTKLGESSVDFKVKYIVHALKRRRVKSDITFKILQLVNQKGNKEKVAIAYPHMQMVLHDDSIKGVVKKYLDK